MSERVLSHFALFSFTDRYAELTPKDRVEVRRAWLAGLRSASPQLAIYQVFPARADADLLVWSSLPVEEPATAGQFFTSFAREVAPRRHLIRPSLTLWGFTRKSAYGSGSSTQEIDPFAAERKPYLILYPFGKTADWYLKSRDVRQGMMNEHIRIGRQYPEIKQLLLYSFGLQDQEFVVVYEADDLPQFMELVNDLRDSEARRYTALDTPTFTAIYHPAEESLALWG